MTKLNVPEMSCGHCKAAVEKAVTSIDAGATVTVDLETRTVEITASVSDATLIEALKSEGYESTAA